MITLVGWVLAVASTVTSAPQAIKILRHRTVAGVSVASCALGAATMGTWVWFTATISDLPALASSIGPLICWSLCLLGLSLHGERRKVLVAVPLAVVGVLCVGLAGVADKVAVAGSLAWVIPQVRATFRHDDLSGVSVLAYSLIAVENAGWVYYAYGTSTWQYAIAPLLQGPAALLIAVRARRNAHLLRARQTSDPI